MKLQRGQTVVLTGASGGLGTYMTRALAGFDVRLALVAHPGKGLEDLAASIKKDGHPATIFTTDLRMADERRRLIQDIQDKLGPIDVLINNAGVEFTSYYHELTAEQIGDVLKVNLEAPMMLSHLVLPGMLERQRGHIVNISSLAGKSGPAFQEPYAATKAALIAFTASLRGTYRGTGVSATVVTPGFVEAGIYRHLTERTGCKAPALLGTSRPEKVAQAIVRAIEQNLPEIIVNPYPVRPLLALSTLIPPLGDRINDWTGANRFFRKVVVANKKQST